MLLQGNVRPRIRIYDLANLDVFFGEIIELTTTEFNASPDAQAYVSRGLLTQIPIGTPTPNIVPVSDVDPRTFNVRPGTIGLLQLDPSLQLMVQNNDFFWAQDPHFVDNPDRTLTFAAGSLVFQNIAYALSASSTAAATADSYLVALLNSTNQTMTVRFETIPYSKVDGELLIGSYDYVDKELFVFKGISQEAEDIAFIPTGTNFTSLTVQAALEELSGWLSGSTFPENVSFLMAATKGFGVTAPSGQISFSAGNGSINMVTGLGANNIFMSSTNVQIVGQTNSIDMSDGSGNLSVQAGANKSFKLRTVGSGGIDFDPGNGLIRFMGGGFVSTFITLDRSTPGALKILFPSATDALTLVPNNGFLVDATAASGSTTIELKTSGGVIDLTSLLGAVRVKVDSALVVQNGAGSQTHLIIDGNTTPGTTLIDAGANSLTIGNAVNAGQIEILTAGQSIILDPGNGNIVMATDPGGSVNITTTRTVITSSIREAVNAIADLPAGGSIGSAATTVDIRSAFTINQTTAGQTITLPNPTVTTGGLRVIVMNIGTEAFLFYGQNTAIGDGAQVMWNGTAWSAIH